MEDKVDEAQKRKFQSGVAVNGDSQVQPSRKLESSGRIFLPIEEAEISARNPDQDKTCLFKNELGKKLLPGKDPGPANRPVIPRHFKFPGLKVRGSE